MWQLIQDNFISHYHEYIGDLHHMLVALSKIQTFVFSWTPLVYIDEDPYNEPNQLTNHYSSVLCKSSRANYNPASSAVDINYIFPF